MRIAALALALAALPAWAEKPDEFRSTAPITVAAPDSLQRIVLPPELYRDARRDLADVRVFNAREEPVPIAFAGEADLAREPVTPVALPFFPVSTVPPAGGLPTEISIKAADGTLVTIRGGAKAGSLPPRVTSYYLDASQVKETLRALDFDWAAAPGTQVVAINVEASEDLRSWSHVAAHASLVRLEHGGRVLGQKRVQFAPRKAKYLRVSWSGGDFELRGVDALPEERFQPPPRAERTVRGASGPKPGEIVHDLGARFPVETLLLRPRETNTVLAATVLTRDDEKADWRPLTHATFYRLTRDGQELHSPPFAIGRHTARYWMLRFDAGSYLDAAAPPDLEVQWRPAQLVFVTRGDAPFVLAFGKPDAKAALLPVSSLIPNYERLAEMKLPEARVGEVRSVDRERPLWEQWVGGEVNRRKVVLWLVLFGGVAALAWMAWRLHGQMQSEKAPPGSR